MQSASSRHHGQWVPLARERLMLWMIVNCLAISRGCERDKSTIKFDRLPPSLPPPPLSSAASPVTSLNHSNFPPSFYLCCPHFLSPPSPSQFTLSSFSLLLPKHEFKGDETEISSLWRPPWLCPTLGEDFREIAPSLFVPSTTIYSAGLQWGIVLAGQRRAEWLSCAHMVIIRPSWSRQRPHVALHKAMTPQLSEQ